jgi:hypothetical protein
MLRNVHECYYSLREKKQVVRVLKLTFLKGDNVVMIRATHSYNNNSSSNNSTEIEPTQR